MHVDNSSAIVSRLSIQRWMWGAFAFLATATLLAVIALAPLPAGASVLGDKLAEILGTILAAIVSIVGKLLLAAIYLLTIIAQYNHFIDAAAVKNGWVIVRDVANMFFIVVLLIIAFATILNVSSYQWKAMLPQLLIAAILINFSKTIAGIFIDLSQVIMLTFVNGFAAAAGGNFANMFQIRGLVSLDPSSVTAVGLLQILGGYVLAFVLVTIALVTTLIMAVILAFRIVMLWALVVLSPLPYLLNILPSGKKYGEKWWSMFGEYLTAGPVLAFFLWLALVSIGSGTVADEFTTGGGPGASLSEADQLAQVIGGGIPTEAARPSSLLSFIIGICMLLAGLKITGEMSVMGAGAAKGALDKFGSIAKGAAKKYSGYKHAEALYGIRQKRKEEEFQTSVGRWQGRIGKVQQGVGVGLQYSAGLPGRAAIRLGRFDARSKSAEADAKQATQAAAQARARGDFGAADIEEKKAAAARQRLASIQKTSGRVERWTNVGAATAATIATGGAAAPMFAALAAKGLQNRGKSNIAAGQQLGYQRVSKERDGVKNLKQDEILKKAQGIGTASNAEQMAAIIEAAEKGLFSSAELTEAQKQLSTLGADKKTQSTFQSVAERRYGATMLSDADRRQRVADGTLPIKELRAEELMSNGGALARDLVLTGSDDQRKEAGRSRVHRAAYQSGVKAATDSARARLATMSATDPNRAGAEEDVQKLQTELMRLGGDKAAGQTALQASGMDAAALAKALQGKQSSDLLANIEPADFTNPSILEAIVKSVSAGRLSAAVGSAKKDDDPSKALSLQALQEAIKNSTRAKAYETARAPVRGAEADVASVRKNLEKQQATARRSAAGSPQQAAAVAAVGRLTAELATAEANFQALQTQFEDEMKNVQKMEKQEQALYDSMKKSKNK